MLKKHILLQKLLVLAVYLLFLTGCTPLPEVGPFVDATHQLKSAVAQSGSVVSNELRYMEGGEDYAKKLDTAWEARNRALAATAAYSDSLEAIVSSGNQGAQAAGELIDSVKQFASAAGIVIPGSPAALEVASDSVKLIAKNIALMRAAKSLEEAMVKSQPAVNEIARNIAKDFNDIDVIFRSANGGVKKKLSNDYNDRNAYRKTLQNYLVKANAGNASEAELNKLVQINELLEGTNQWHSEYQQKLEEIDQRLRAGRALLKASQVSIRQWVDAHEQVVRALKNRRPVSTKSLLETSVEIRDLIKRMREL